MSTFTIIMVNKKNKKNLQNFKHPENEKFTLPFRHEGVKEESLAISVYSYTSSTTKHAINHTPPNALTFLKNTTAFESKRFDVF